MIINPFKCILKYLSWLLIRFDVFWSPLSIRNAIHPMIILKYLNWLLHYLLQLKTKRAVAPTGGTPFQKYCFLKTEHTSFLPHAVAPTGGTHFQKSNFLKTENTSFFPVQLPLRGEPIFRNLTFWIWLCLTGSLKVNRAMFSIS